MSAAHSSASRGSAAGAVPEGASLVELLETLRQENEGLGRELLRSYEQLNLVFEITENIAHLQDPTTIQNAVLQRFGAMLGAGAVFLDHGGGCIAVPLAESLGQPVRVDGAEVQASLSREIELVRRTQHVHVCVPQDTVGRTLNGARAMLLALRQSEDEAAVVIALRHREEPAFDSGDMLASESVLGYGGHILANALMVQHMQQMAVETVRALANAIDAKDNYTCGHSERVGWLVRWTGAAMGLPEAQLQALEWAGILHDVGKIGISEQILNKPGKLTEAEFAEMKRHPAMSYEVLKPVARLGSALDGVLYHHENWDGSGYPQGLRGEQIPLFARIIRAADTFDALTSTRSYRKGFTIEQATDILREESGRGIDPQVTTAFIEAFERYRREHAEDFRRRFAHTAQPSGVPPVGGGQHHDAECEPTRVTTVEEAQR